MSGVNEKLKVRPIARRESMIQGENYRIPSASGIQQRRNF